MRFRLPDLIVPRDLSREEMPDLLRHWYLGPRARRYMMLRRFAEVDRRLPPTGAVLDVGSAWGFNVMALSLLGYDATAMDLVEHQFAAGERIAAANGVVLRAVGADATFLPFPAEHFDAVTMVETFEHIFVEDRLPALRECLRVLKPGGRIVLSTPNYGSFVERAKRHISRRAWLRRRLPSMCYPEEGTPRGAYHPYKYHHPSPDSEIESLLDAAGFRVRRSWHFLFMLKNTSSVAFPLLRALEAVAERIPGARALAATVGFVGERPSS